jgi:hypothetical protein
MPWTIYWDNGIDCGTFSHWTFDTEEQAQECADSVTEDYIADGIWDEEGFAEPYWLEPPLSPEEVEAIAEQSPDYFNRYIAGDK